MAGTSLLALIDDIASILDDVAVLSKVAAKKTAGVLGDDLALNAQQVSGVNADRELPVVWAVAKGSAVNKLILVPTALAISAFLPFLVLILLTIGGLYLCFEGAEKIFEKFFHHSNANEDSTIKPVTEADKIKGAIRTDFILSAEIITISLGAVSQAPFAQQVLSISTVAAGMTVGVYGFVALIVKLDDFGLYLLKTKNQSAVGNLKKYFGKIILAGAPYLMKSLGIVGTIAMFLVGGSLIVHSMPAVHHFVLELPGYIQPIAEGFLGLVSGAMIVALKSALVKKQRN